jgi:hypothetical protein
MSGRSSHTLLWSDVQLLYLPDIIGALILAHAYRTPRERFGTTRVLLLTFMSLPLKSTEYDCHIANSFITPRTAFMATVLWEQSDSYSMYCFSGLNNL